MVEKSGVEKFLFALGLKSSWLKNPGLKDLGLKRGVEKSRVEMSFNLEMNPGDKSDFILKQSENVKQFPVLEL